MTQIPIGLIPEGLHIFNNNMKQQDIIFFLVSSCVVVFVWIAFSIIHSSQTSTISDETTQIIQPISATFDTTTLNFMAKKQNIASETTIKLVSPTETTTIQGATPTPTVVAIPTIATTSATSASGGAQ